MLQKKGAHEWLWLLGWSFLLLLSGCSQISGPTVLVEGTPLEPGETGRLLIRIVNVENLKVMQVGPVGALVFDPEVIQIQALTGRNGFQVFVSAIDNTQGRVLFLTGIPGGSLTNGIVLELEVKAVGSAGSSSWVEFTELDLLADQAGHTISNVELRKGRVTIAPFGLTD